MIMIGRLKGWSLKSSNNFVIKFFHCFFSPRKLYGHQPKSFVVFPCRIFGGTNRDIIKSTADHGGRFRDKQTKLPLTRVTKFPSRGESTVPELVLIKIYLLAISPHHHKFIIKFVNEVNREISAAMT